MGHPYMGLLFYMRFCSLVFARCCFVFLQAACEQVFATASHSCAWAAGTKERDQCDELGECDLATEKQQILGLGVVCTTLITVDPWIPIQAASGYRFGPSCKYYQTKAYEVLPAWGKSLADNVSSRAESVKERVCKELFGGEGYKPPKGSTRGWQLRLPPCTSGSVLLSNTHPEEVAMRSMLEASLRGRRTVLPRDGRHEFHQLALWEMQAHTCSIGARAA